MSVTVTRRRRGDLPVEVTSFVGRRRELAEIRSLLSSCRLVTVSGAGGVGKTRLAVKAAHDLRRAFADGVWMVELADLNDPGLVAHTVATAIGLRLDSSRRPVDQLREYLADKQALILLDNCEHLVDACAVLVDALLRACPRLRVLATSRHSLGITGECTMAVPPLSVPGPDAADSAEGALTSYDSVRLLQDRVGAVLPGFAVTHENSGTVAQLCQRLEGIPLAIEMATVRLRALSLEQVLDRLDDQFWLLTSGDHVEQPRQQTLRALMDWSYDLLTEQERLLWARASVFVGGFQLDAAEGICAGHGVPADAVLDLVASLIDKSILVREDQGSVSRYRQLETVRQYGMEKLEQSGEEVAVRRRHRDWYQQLVERAAAEWISPRQAYWLTRLDLELPNVRAAVEFSISEPDEVDRALLMIVTPWRIYWWAHGLISEGRHWLSRALERATEPTVAQARALLLSSHLAVYQGDFATGAAHLEEGMALARQLGDPLVLAYAGFSGGMGALYAGDMSAAIERFEQGLAAASQVPDVSWRLDILLPLAPAYGFTGSPEKEVACHEEILSITEPRGERFHRSYSLWALGVNAWQQGDLRRAQALEAESLRLKRELDDRLGTVFCMEAFAWIAATEGRAERAARLLGAAATLWESMGSSPTTAGHLAAFHQSCEQETRQALGEAAYEAAYQQGMSLPSEDAVALALEEQRPEAPAGSSAQAAQPLSPLTRREQQIAELVAEGLSNKDIASRLVIAQRTAEGHVERILAKLGFSSRSQVAAWVAERRADGRSES